MLTSYLVVFGALSRMVKVRDACDNPFRIYKRLNYCAAPIPDSDHVLVVASLACHAHKNGSSSTTLKRHHCLAWSNLFVKFTGFARYSDVCTGYCKTFQHSHRSMFTMIVFCRSLILHLFLFKDADAVSQIAVAEIDSSNHHMIDDIVVRSDTFLGTSVPTSMTMSSFL